MKHACKMNTVVLKSFKDTMNIPTESAIIAGTFKYVQFTIFAETH